MMETLIKIAKENPLISDVAEDIEALWIKLGSPTEPDGPDTSVHGSVPAWLDPDELEGLSEEEAIVQAARYNKALEQLLELTGIWNAGGNTWHKKWNRGGYRGAEADAWDEFMEESWDLALNHVANILWDRFCDSM